jgi:hypothetical protein
VLTGCRVSARCCKWLPDCLKEDCVGPAHCVEKALLKAVRDSSQSTIISMFHFCVHIVALLVLRK